MKNRPLPSQEVLRSLLDYNPETGHLTWRPRTHGPLMPRPGEVVRWNNRYAGQRALTHAMPKGHLRGAVLGEYFMAHRVVWKWMTGEEPDQIDHIDHDPANNRFTNLRACDATANMRNRPLNRNSTSGVTGVKWNKLNRNWRASIRANGSTVNVGSFERLEDAAAARKEAERRYGYHPNHGL